MIFRFAGAKLVQIERKTSSRLECFAEMRPNFAISLAKLVQAPCKRKFICSLRTMERQVHKFVVHKFVNLFFYLYLCGDNTNDEGLMVRKPFVYGTSVDDEHFTDRVKETKRLKLDFEHGINTIIISPRRMGKTSLVRRVMRQITDEQIKVVFMDVYDCRTEYDFYNRFATSVIRDTASRLDRAMDYVKEFLVRLVPKVSFSPEANTEFSLSLGITPESYTPEEILNLPEEIAQSKGVHVIVCIDEFQQIGDFPDSLSVQKRMRGVWQHQRNVSYCLFGSKRHLMAKLFQSANMPFFHFGEMMFLQPIPVEDWVPYVQERFQGEGKSISEEMVRRICLTVRCQSSYVQQLSWNVLANTEDVVGDKQVDMGVEELIIQCSSLFLQQLDGLSTYQMNLLRAIRDGVHGGYTSHAVMQNYNFGTKSNVTRIQQALIERELIDITDGSCDFADAVFGLWFRRHIKD